MKTNFILEGCEVKQAKHDTTKAVKLNARLADTIRLAKVNPNEIFVYRLYPGDIYTCTNLTLPPNLFLSAINYK